MNVVVRRIGDKTGLTRFTGLGEKVTDGTENLVNHVNHV